MNSRGGKRVGAGRKPMFTVMTVMALRLRVKEIRRANPRLSNKAALTTLQRLGEIPKGPVENYLRHLTPKSLNVGIRYGLALVTERAGILSAITLPKTLKYSPKKKAVRKSAV
jgi:hypothetical protein